MLDTRVFFKDFLKFVTYAPSMAFATVKHQSLSSSATTLWFVTIRSLILMAVFVSSLLLSLKSGLKDLWKSLGIFLSSFKVFLN